VTLRPVVVVDPEPVPPSASILVLSTQHWAQKDVQDDEWLNADVFYERLGWLEATALAGCRATEIDAQHGGDAWAAAAVARSDVVPPQGSIRRLVALVHGEAKNAQALQKAKQAARIGQNDAARMHEELASAQAELAQVKKQLRNQQKAADDLRNELIETAGELDETKAKLKGYNLTRQGHGEAQQRADGPSGTGVELDLSQLRRLAQIVTRSFDTAVEAIDSTQTALEFTGVQVSPRDEDPEQ